jgi:hypothetical protein
MSEATKYEAIPVQDGLTKTAQIVSGEGRRYACSIQFRPATGLRAIVFDTDFKLADGNRQQHLLTELIVEHVIQIEGVQSSHAKGAKPREATVKDLIPLLDAETILGIQRKITEAAWNVDKLLGN